MEHTGRSTKYFSILEPLVVCTTLPRYEHIVEIITYDGRTLTANSIGIYDGVLSAVLNNVIHEFDLDGISSVVHHDKLIYPDLPLGYAVPNTREPMRWVITTLRVILAKVNSNSNRDHGAELVIATDINCDYKRLSLTMTKHWSILPVFVRDKFLESLWNIYCILLSRYGAGDDYKSIELHSSDKPGIIGYRTQWSKFVDGSSEKYCPPPLIEEEATDDRI